MIMGLDIYTKLIIGFPFEPNEIVSDAPSGDRACPGKHVIKEASSSFCPVCGQRLVQPTVKVFNEDFVRYAASVKYEAKNLYDRWICCSNEKDLQVHRVDPLQYGEGEDVVIHAVGFNLAGFDCARPRDMILPVGVSLDKIQDCKELLEEVMKGLKITRDIKLYICADISY